jgi:hypothetical protein
VIVYVGVVLALRLSSEDTMILKTLLRRRRGGPDSVGADSVGADSVGAASGGAASGGAASGGVA